MRRDDLSELIQKYEQAKRAEGEACEGARKEDEELRILWQRIEHLTHDLMSRSERRERIDLTDLWICTQGRDIVRNAMRPNGTKWLALSRECGRLLGEIENRLNPRRAS
jgi:hypothetical protein